MPILADYHLHSTFSGDGHSSLEEMVLQGISQGLTHMCFTEHMDLDYVVRPGDDPHRFEVNTDSYLYELLRVRDKYAGQIKVNFGIELGLQPQIVRENAVYAKSYDFDFIIGSSHLCDHKDPYDPDYFIGVEEDAAYRRYFESILENIKKFSNFDVYGHLDYIVRKGPNMDRFYSYEKFKDLFDAILEYLVENGKGLEINTAAIKYGLKQLHPHIGILKRYRELGGEIITIGSDSHDTRRIAEYFDMAADLLLECGFKYYTIFENRLPEFKRI